MVRRKLLASCKGLLIETVILGFANNNDALIGINGLGEKKAKTAYNANQHPDAFAVYHSRYLTLQ
jgi:hypothetical protein